jgi:hypothetical protein
MTPLRQPVVAWGGVNQDKGIIVHLPAGSGKCELHFVDIKQGWKGIELAMKVRAFRDTKKSLVTSIKENNMTAQKHQSASQLNQQQVLLLLCVLETAEELDQRVALSLHHCISNTRTRSSSSW